VFKGRYEPLTCYTSDLFSRARPYPGLNLSHLYTPQAE
jgi:hypothetical protein